MKTVILIPAYKPEESFVRFTTELIQRGHTVVAVDDGGGSAFAEIFARVSELDNVTVLHHEVNRGKGAALRTGFEYINNNMPDVMGVVTADCDGQHKIDDIERIIVKMEENEGKLILGGRFTESDVKIPIKSQIGNTLTRWVFFIATGLKIRDTQTGLRGIPKKLLPEMLKIKGDRYEYEMNMLLYLRDWDCGFVEMPIETIYENNNAGSHYNPLKDSLRILGQILKFSLTSFLSFLVDYILFLLLNHIILDEFLIAGFSLSYILARVVSASLNYVLNRHFVFKKGGKASIPKYAALAVIIMLVGSLVTGLLQNHLGWPAIICKICIDVPLYFVNYKFQRDWVFKKKK